MLFASKKTRRRIGTLIERPLKDILLIKGPMPSLLSKSCICVLGFHVLKDVLEMHVSWADDVAGQLQNNVNQYTAPYFLTCQLALLKNCLTTEVTGGMFKVGRENNSFAKVHIKL